MNESVAMSFSIMLKSMLTVIAILFQLKGTFIIAFIIAGIITGIIFKIGMQNDIWFGKFWGKIIATLSFAVTFSLVKFVVRLFA